MNGDKKAGYDVGYGKPPKTTQFRKGKSGNPRGRPKGGFSHKKDIAEMLRQTVTMTVDGRPRKVSAHRAATMRLLDRAMKGDMKALEKVLSMGERLSEELEAAEQDQKLSRIEGEVLARYIADVTNSASSVEPYDEAGETKSE